MKKNSRWKKQKLWLLRRIRLWVLGHMDARRGDPVVAAQCERLCCQKELAEVAGRMRAEKQTQSIREAADRSLAERRKLLDWLARQPPVLTEEGPTAIRRQRKDALEREQAKKQLDACEQKLIHAQESLAYTRSMLEEWMLSGQAVLRESLSIYRKAAGRQPLPAELKQAGISGMEKYLGRHETLDSELCRITEWLRKEREAC